MKILLLTNYFFPEVGAASHLFFELAEGLVEKGHQVTVLTGFPRYNITSVEDKYKGKWLVDENYRGIKIARIKIPSISRGAIPVLRGIEHLLISLLLLLRGIFLERHDLMLIYSPPLTLGLTGIVLRFIKKMPFIFNVQDLFPQSAIDLGVMKKGITIRFFQKLEKFIYKKADYITVHSNGNREHILLKNDKAEKIKTIHNWLNTSFITKGEKNNDFSREFGLSDKFIVSFAGTMGYSQDMKVIVEAARILKDKKDILFILVGGGMAFLKVVQLVEEYNLKNIKFIPMQPRHRYPLVLNSSDISLVTLKKEVMTPTIPSKILSIMASCKPLVASMNLDGDAPKIIKESNSGLVVTAGDAKAMASAILKLYSNPLLCRQMGGNGRAYVEAHFSLSLSLSQYQQLFDGLIL
ncbi:MAG: glycosyltransferase family 4 protein [Candidatus Saganbacteria bacterium]|nr:glycosyltransferase family 4 protein [Candidatus Saganbacteria bacterium]